MADGVGNVKVDDEDCIFIDRSPLAFRFILNFLRGEPFDVKMMNPVEKSILRVDAEFYELTELQSLLGGGASGSVPSSSPSSSAPSRPQEPNPALQKVVADAWADLDTRRAILKEKADSRKRLLQKIESTVSVEKVKLQLMQDDARFATQQCTLTSHPDSKLARQFSNLERLGQDKLKDGSVFIDKDGAVFEHVLNLLRGYPLPDGLSEQQLESLKHDLEWFMLDDLLKSAVPPKVEKWVLTASPNGQVGDDGRSFTKTSGGDTYNCGVFGSIGWDQGVHAIQELHVKH